MEPAVVSGSVVFLVIDSGQKREVHQHVGIKIYVSRTRRQNLMSYKTFLGSLKGGR